MQIVSPIPRPPDPSPLEAPIFGTGPHVVGSIYILFGQRKYQRVCVNAGLIHSLWPLGFVRPDGFLLLVPLSPLRSSRPPIIAEQLINPNSGALSTGCNLLLLISQPDPLTRSLNLRKGKVLGREVLQ